MTSRISSIALALRTLEYVGWLDGTFQQDLDADVEMKDLALAVFAEAGVEAPMRKLLSEKTRRLSIPSGGKDVRGDKEEILLAIRSRLVEARSCLEVAEECLTLAIEPDNELPILADQAAKQMGAAISEIEGAAARLRRLVLSEEIAHD